ncbi:immunity protein Imm33 domain-containing protein, partial [Bacillus wiedmannii]|uniref:immunity protein Imm33 domain-containing protein n=1 Tax=Bacillus wiedmannii TaxID=1890302 RepID=UPI0034D6D6BE
NNPKNFKIIPIGVILNMDDSILNFLEEPPLCAYERNDEGRFYKIEDYDWDVYLNGKEKVLRVKENQ